MIRYVGSAIFDSWGAHGSIEEHRMTSVILLFVNSKNDVKYYLLFRR